MILALDGVIILALCVIAYVDLRQMIIPDMLSLGVAIAAGLAAFLSGWDACLDAALGAVIAFALFEGTRRVMSIRLKREAMGFGDVKLMTAGGLWVGAQSLSVAVLLACFAALVGFGILAAFNRASLRSVAMPFGPYLALGLIVTKFLLLFGFV